MIADLDIYDAAKLLVDRHGEDALTHADERAQQMLEEGDLDGARIWRVIMSAIKELQRDRLEGESVN